MPGGPLVAEVEGGRHVSTAGNCGTTFQCLKRLILRSGKPNQSCPPSLSFHFPYTLRFFGSSPPRNRVPSDEQWTHRIFIAFARPFRLFAICLLFPHLRKSLKTKHKTKPKTQNKTDKFGGIHIKATKTHKIQNRKPTNHTNPNPNKPTKTQDKRTDHFCRLGDRNETSS